MAEYKIKVRHLVKKGDAYYFQPSKSMLKRGYIPKSLGKNPASAIEYVNEKNKEWDALRKSEQTHESKPVHGTIKWLIQNHRKSVKWLEKSKSAQYEFNTFTALFLGRCAS